MWQRILALVVKELLALLRDRRQRIIVIVPPIIQVIIFSYAATFSLHNIPFAVYTQDPGNAAQTLISDFAGSPNFHRVGNIENQAQIAPMINNRRALLVLNIGSDFSRNLYRGIPAKVQVILDGRDSDTALITLDYANTIINGFNTAWRKSHALPHEPIRLVNRAWFNSNLESGLFIVPGVIGIILLVVVVMSTALSVAREREQGTFDQLLVTPLRLMEILIGKALPGMLIGLIEASLVLLIALYWFHIPLRGHLGTLYLGFIIFILSGIGVGLMVSSLAATLQQALLGAFMFLVPAVILSGFATPVSDMPAAVQAITTVDPLRYFLVIVRSTFLEGMPLPLLLNQFWPMALIGVVTLAGSGWLFRHRMY